MNEGDFIVFKTYYDKQIVEELAVQLKRAGIGIVLEDNSTHFDPTFTFNELNKAYRILIKPSDMEAANAVLSTAIQHELSQLPADYYLFKFEDHELIEIILKRHEWGEYDYELARKLLTERGKVADLVKAEAIVKKQKG